MVRLCAPRHERGLPIPRATSHESVGFEYRALPGAGEYEHQDVSMELRLGIGHARG